jgi:hypothetical protein
MNSPFLAICLLLTFFLSSPLLIHIAYATDQTANSIIVHGGGMASIGCPDGSSVDTDISFDAVKSVNGTILGNWTIDSTEKYEFTDKLFQSWTDLSSKLDNK